MGAVRYHWLKYIKLKAFNNSRSRQLAGCPLRDQVPDYPALTGQGIKGFKIGILKESLTVKTTDNRVAALVKRAALKFADMGAQVEEVSVPDHVLGPELWAVSVTDGA